MVFDELKNSGKLVDWLQQLDVYLRTNVLTRQQLPTFAAMWTSPLQQCVFVLAMMAILHSAFWLTYVTLEIYDLMNLPQKPENIDAHLFSDIALFGNILVVFFISILLLFGNLTQKTTFYWIYLIVNGLIMLPLGPTFSFVPFPAQVISTQTLIFGISTLFQFVSMVIIWMATKESTKTVDMEKGAILSSDNLTKPDEKNPNTLKF